MQSIGRFFAIDYGKKRTGLAVSDTTHTLAVALDTIDSGKLLMYIKTYLQSESIVAFILGMPKDLQGRDTHTTADVLALKKNLEHNFPNIPCHLVDERFTSKMAFQYMIASGASKKDRNNKGNIDKLSAAIILQEFLDFKVVKSG